MKDFIITLFTDGGPGTYVALCATIFMILAIVVDALNGFRIGFPRQGLKALFTIVAVFVAFFIVDDLCNDIFSAFEEKRVAECLTLVEGNISIDIPTAAREIILKIDPIVLEYILAMLFSPLAAPIIFTIVFLILYGLYGILYYIVRWICRIGKKGGIKSRTLGAVVGAARGFIIAAIIILPLTVFADITNVLVEAEIENTDDKELQALYEDDISDTTCAPVFKTVKALGGEAVLNAFGTVKNSDTTFKAREEFFIILKGALTHADTISELDLNDLTGKEKKAIEDILDFVNDSDFLSTILAEVLSASADLIEEEAGVSKGDASEILIKAITDIFRTTSKETVVEDVKAMSDILIILNESGTLDAISEGQDPGAVFNMEDKNGKTVVNRVVEIIDENPRFQAVKTALVEVSIAMLAENDVITKESYQNIKTGFKIIVTMNKPDPAEASAYNSYLSIVSASIDQTLSAEGISIEKNLCDSMAEYLAENYGGQTAPLSDGEFNDIMLNYYDAYLKANQNVDD